MNRKNENAMKKIVLMLTAALWLLPAAAQQTEAYPSYIQVNGHAEKEVAPDEFYLSILIDEKDSKGKSSVEEQEGKMVAELKKLKINVKEDLRMANMSSEFFKRKTSLARAKYQLKLSSAEQVARVTDILTALGISNVSIQSVTYSRIEELQQEVRAEAIRNARACARTLAEAIGQQAGRCVTIIDYTRPTRMYRNNVVEFTAAKMADAAGIEEEFDREVPEFRLIRIEHDVQAKFILE